MSISDNELAWIGAVTVYWATAEQFLDMLIGMFARWDAQGTKFLGKKKSNFVDKLDNAKKVIRLRFDDLIIESEIGIALMVRGKALSEDRKRFGHWLAQSTGDNAPGISFTNLDIIDSMDVINEPYTEDQIQILVTDICDWGFEVARYGPMCFMHGPLSLRTTTHGPEDNLPVLKWEDFRTIQKISRIRPKK